MIGTGVGSVPYAIVTKMQARPLMGQTRLALSLQDIGIEALDHQRAACGFEAL
jgi:hypothetical protein